MDPPPIVELHVFDGETDITFAHNANFFLYTTLESARQLAHGRGMPHAQAPVLTGTPVAGTAYLDRPGPAGYFIFPDLSIRHEGLYRLAFNLYEELKDEKDEDAVDQPPPPGTLTPTPTTPGAPNGHISFRLEVKSMPFPVFSAKKFPGLAESTSLSRVVADQGCRVRIRRDVRMRRRESKAPDDWDELDIGAPYERARRTATPDAYAAQAAPTPPQHPVQRAPCVDVVSQSYQLGVAAPAQHPPPAAAMAAQAPQPVYPAQLQYPSPSPQPYLSQQYMTSQQTAAPQLQMLPYQEPQFQMQSSSQQLPADPAASYAYAQQDYLSQSTYEQPQQLHDSSCDYPSQSALLTPPSAQPGSVHEPVGNSVIQEPSGGESQPVATHAEEDASPYQPEAPASPPLRVPEPVQAQPTPDPPAESQSMLSTSSTEKQAPEPEPEPDPDPTSEVSVPVNAASASPPSDTHGHEEVETSAPEAAPSPQPSGSVGGKRAFGSAFDTAHIERPLRSGARPDAPTSLGLDDPTTILKIDKDHGPDNPAEAAAMIYRRANGAEMVRKTPRLH